MTSYSRNEIISASNIVRGFSSILTNVINKKQKRIAISKNNKLEAVLINIEEYEKLKEASDILEHIDIYNTVQDRKNSKTISLEESMKKHNIKLDEI